MHATQTGTMSALCKETVRPVQPTNVRRTVFSVVRNRREAANGRLLCATRLCATRLCAARRVSKGQDDSARRREQVHTKMYVIRPRRRLWLCFGERGTTSDSVCCNQCSQSNRSNGPSRLDCAIVRKIRASFSSSRRTHLSDQSLPQ
jgi:hypothetical protein